MDRRGFFSRFGSLLTAGRLARFGGLAGALSSLSSRLKGAVLGPLDPVVASADGLTLTPYSGPALTVGGEINKLASNIAIGRNAAGVHWRTDATEGMKLGEAIAISLLRDLTAMYTEDFGGFSFTKFDGTPITVCRTCEA